MAVGLICKKGHAIVPLSLAMMVIMTVGWTYGATPFNATFDFSTGQPAMIPGQNTPFNQTAGGVAARFTSPSDPDAFSIQTYSTTFFVLPDFSGNFIYDNKPLRNTLEIYFNQSITGISFVFATLEYHGGPADQPTEIRLTAYMNSTDTVPIGSATSRATWSSSSTFPQGVLSYGSSGQPFNIVRIELYGKGVAVDFLVDNVTVTGILPGTEFPPPGGLGTGISIGYFLAGVIGVVALAVAVVWSRAHPRGKNP